MKKEEIWSNIAFIYSLVMISVVAGLGWMNYHNQNHESYIQVNIVGDVEVTIYGNHAYQVEYIEIINPEYASRVSQYDFDGISMEVASLALIELVGSHEKPVSIFIEGSAIYDEKTSELMQVIETKSIHGLIEYLPSEELISRPAN